MVSIEDLISANTPLHKLNYTNKRYALSRLIGLKRVTHFRQSRGYLQRSQFLPIEAAARRVDNRQVTQGSHAGFHRASTTPTDAFHRWSLVLRGEAER